MLPPKSNKLAGSGLWTVAMLPPALSVNESGPIPELPPDETALPNKLPKSEDAEPPPPL